MLEFHRISDLLECHRTQRESMKFAKNIAPCSSRNPRVVKSQGIFEDMHIKRLVHIVYEIWAAIIHQRGDMF